MILVKLKDPKFLEEMAIIELQGDLECRTESRMESQFIGDLYFKTQLDGSIQPVLVIGHHILNGKIQNLENQLAVMEPHRTGGDSQEFLIKSVITKKISFKTRPKPIIVNH